MPRVLFVVPCFNEEKRLRLDAFTELARRLSSVGVSTQFCFVDDGSTDLTSQVLHKMIENRGIDGWVKVMNQNVGKAEAIRYGLRDERAETFELVGYMDADFAIPPEDVQRFVQTALICQGRKIFLASRVVLMGSAIERRHGRHLIGRFVAQLVRAKLGIYVYDSQCGLKLFLNDQQFQRVLEDAFRYRWLVDLEILLRLRSQSADFKNTVVEIPIYTWSDVRRSKVRAREALREILAILFIR